MKKLRDVLQSAFRKRLWAEGVEQKEYADYLKWLRYYLDFCFKYRHPPRDGDSLEPFLQKLASKRESITGQKQAAASVGYLLLRPDENLAGR